MRTPVVEMLWETLDPHHVLGARFGLSDGNSASRWVAAMVEEHWGVRIDSCERVVISGHNALAWVTTPSGRMVLKWSVVRERFLRLSALSRLTRWLDGHGLAVSTPVPALDGRVQVEVDGASMCLQREIEGTLLDTADPDQVSAAGAVLARLQDALAAYPDADQILMLAGPPEPLAARVATWLDSGVTQVPAPARDTLRRVVADAPPGPLPVQLLHQDFRSASVVCAGARVAAVLDFEEAGIDHRVVELARSAVLLGTRFHSWGPVSTEVRARFLLGYQSVRCLTPTEAAWWDILVLWHSLAMVPPGDDPTGWTASALASAAEMTPAV